MAMHRFSRFVSGVNWPAGRTRAEALHMGACIRTLPGDVCGAHAEGDENMRVAPPRAARIGGAVRSLRSLDVGEDVTAGKDRYFACFALPIWVKNAS